MFRIFHPAHGSMKHQVGFERQRNTNLLVKLPRYIFPFAIKTYILRAERILFDDSHCDSLRSRSSTKHLFGYTAHHVAAPARHTITSCVRWFTRDSVTI
jgi:hypothetical protein